jgi:transcription antitermination factor NusG
MGKKKNNRRRDKEKAVKAKAEKPKVEVVNGRTRTRTKNPPPEGLDPSLHWYLVYTAPRAEAKVREKLVEAGCSVFWPSEHIVITAPKRKPIEMDVGTFPRYLFAAGYVFQQRSRDEVHEGNRVVTIGCRPLDNISDIDGVVEVVYGGPGQYLRVPSAVIEAIAGYQISKEEPKPEPRFSAGTKAIINDGPFRAFSATVVEAIGLTEAKVIVEIFGGKVPVQIDLRQLDAA